MKIGDRVTVTPEFDGSNQVPVQGIVTYIHPERRFYEVEITAPSGLKFRESFAFQYRRGNGE